MRSAQGSIRSGMVLAAMVIGPAWAAASIDGLRYSPGPQPAAKEVANQFVDAQQLRIDDVVGLTADQSTPSTHRTVVAWQINAGCWNGQQLDGLALVLVQTSSDEPAAAETAIYISDQATTTQRDALLAALSAAHPALFVPREANYRVEPADIRVEQSAGHRVVLHVGTIAANAVARPHVA